MTDTLETNLESWRVVIIDDSSDDRDEVRRLLLRGSERRYVFSEASTGAAGVAAVRAYGAVPDCVVLDFYLPDMNALDVLVDLAGPGGLPICPIVVLTGGTGPDAGRQVLRAGAQDYISKDGLTAPALTRIVENAIERLAMSRELLGRNTALLITEQKLSDADQRKDEFIATLAHELRNPLAPISSGLHVLRLTMDPRTSLRTLDIMDRQLRRMTRLIDDLLDISRITTGKILLRLERVLVSTLLEEAAESARAIMNAGNHTLKIDVPLDPLWLNVDPVRMDQVIGNLLNNSAKFSDNGGTITLSASLAGGDVVIQVADTGLGIPEAMLGQVFGIFTQVNRSLDRGQGGLGIGLALVKQLVEMHGGTVAVESPGPRQGSTFSVQLPAAAAPSDTQDDVRAEVAISR